MSSRSSVLLTLLVTVLFVSSQGVLAFSPKQDNSSSPDSAKSSAAKKRKKKKTKALVPSFVILGLPAQAQTAPVPAAPAAPAIDSVPLIAPKGLNGAEKVTPVHISPVIDQVPLGPGGSLIISEFRLTGINGFADEFIEIYNNSGADHTVAASSGTGYAIAASDGIVRCSIPNGTVIPARGHYLCVNSAGYALGSYPSGSGTATGDASYVTQITDGEDPDGAGGNPPLPHQGIALFNNNSGGGSFSLANRFDAVGPVAEANSLYKEGAGLPNLTPFAINYSWVRDECGKGGAVNLLGRCTISTPKDTDNNSADFYFVDANGTSAGGGQRLGVPGPQNLGSPIQRNSTITENLLDSTVARSNPPNRVRDFTPDGANNSSQGTISIRRRYVNNTGASITRLRFRIIDIDTFPAAFGFADLRPRTSGAVVVAGINDPVTCAATGAPATPPCTATVQGTTLEQATAPSNQPNGGGFNSSLGAGTVTLGTPLANGASINLQFLIGIQQVGNYRVYLAIEALP